MPVTIGVLHITTFTWFVQDNFIEGLQVPATGRTALSISTPAKMRRVITGMAELAVQHLFSTS